SFFISTRTGEPCRSWASPSSPKTLSEYNPYTREEAAFARVFPDRLRRRLRSGLTAARSRHPLRARPRDQPGHEGLGRPPAGRGRARRLRGGRDRARHARRALDLDEGDLPAPAARED